MIALDLHLYHPRTKAIQNKLSVFDPIRKKWIVVTPEEWIRQLLLLHLQDQNNYPAAKIAVEKTVRVNGLTKRFDLVVYGPNWTPWMIVECKAPDVAINEKSFHQLLQYQSQLQAKYWLLTNGHQTFCANASSLPEIKWLDSLPTYER